MRSSRWIGGVVAALLLAAGGGCSSEVQVEVKVDPTKLAAPKPPPPDADGDGFPDDGTDECITEKEDGLPPNAKDGCRSNDADNDGVAGVNDKCPTEPETKNDFKDEDGCPDQVPRVVITKTEVKITEKVLFASGKATIDPASDGLLDDIAKVLKDNPQVDFIEVAGHADKVGSDTSNVALTKKRAQAVVDALVKRGVSKDRMRAAGYGRYCPVDPADSEEAKEKNRRVEIKIMRVEGKDTGIALGCEEAAAKGIKPAGVPATAPKSDAPAKSEAEPAAPAGEGAKTPAAGGAAPPSGAKP